MILIIDDDKAVRLSLSMLLRRAGHTAIEADGPDAAILAARNTPSLKLVMMDMNFSRATTGREGIELLRRMKVLLPDVPVILMTAWGSIPLAVEGMRHGAFDFITKPWDNRLMLQRVETALSVSAPESPQPGPEGFDTAGIIGRNPALLEVLETARRVAATDAPVLILGENGTGKELVAQAIHRNSHRRANPFVMVNLGGISQSLFESEMFGHVKGAYTDAGADRKGRFEMAHTGTIFLDEIGDLDLACQVKLLRVLQQHTFERLGESKPRSVDFRLIAATNADLPAMVRDRTFREDLLYRINLITLRLPPLRERRDDIPLLVSHFAQLHCQAAGTAAPHITADAMRFLASLPYPGNIRELKNLVERTLIVSDSPSLGEEQFRAQHNLSAPARQFDLNDSSTLGSMERIAVAKALDECGGNISQAAAALGITRQTLYRKLEKYGISPRRS
ncbi:MAG: sigma-54 dependent transcriptional regulator [Muribaculaceae bacterium]|nr:sigma-54 dependent transcriptional regulator [Muribaculaceae bacterium]